MSRKFEIRAAWIAAALSVGCVLAPPAVASATAPTGIVTGAAVSSAAQEPTPASATGARQAERQIRRCANSERRKAGLPRLEASPVLGRAARRHARDMAGRDYFDHMSPNGDGPWDRVEKIDRKGAYSWVGENIAAGYSDPKAACEGWMESSGHRANILNPNYTSMGGGYAEGGHWGRYYVQVFAKRG